MDNQHKLIKGYRDLDEDDIARMNEVKELASRVGDVCDRLKLTECIDQRWLAIARTQLQQGFMALVRSVEKPDRF